MVIQIKVSVIKTTPYRSEELSTMPPDERKFPSFDKFGKFEKVLNESIIETFDVENVEQVRNRISGIFANYDPMPIFVYMGQSYKNRFLFQEGYYQDNNENCNIYEAIVYTKESAVAGSVSHVVTSADRRDEELLKNKVRKSKSLFLFPKLHPF